jgi:antitoxin component YwqK of YwqJK toxin-antitoxin module
MKLRHLIAFFAILCSFAGCTVERAEEHILARHANGVKKTSIWVYPDGTILKRNEWYNDGIKELEIPYEDSLPHGEFKRWTGFGDVAMIGNYKKGKKDGKWTVYYQNKKVEAVQFYKDDHPVGDWEGWHHNGEKAFEWHYDDNGNHIGVWKHFHDNGVLAEENRCHEVNGYVKRFGRNCKITEYFDCDNGNLEGNYKKYYESYGPVDSTKNCEQAQIMEEGIIESQLAPLPLTFYRADGSLIKKIKSSFFKGREKIQWFDENNNVIRESNFITEETDGPHEGIGITYGTCANSSTLFCAETSFVRSSWPSGTLDSCTLSFKDAYKKNIGKYPASLRYIQKGHVLLYEEFWAYDEPPSSYGDPTLRTSRSFYPDSMGGRMASEGFWQGGKRHGIWRNWYPSGILKDSLNYVNGERVGEQFSYDSTGKLTIHKTEAGKNRPVIMHILGN